MTTTAPRPFDVALVLSGGNALGSYHAGVYQALHERGLLPDWVAGASAGAINGAVICGNPAEKRLSALGALWTPGGDYPSGYSGFLEDARRTAAVATTMAAGRPGVFLPRYLSWLGGGFAAPEPASLYDTLPMRAGLAGLVDFDLLNGGDAPRYCATAIDIENGEDVVFDTRCRRLGADHIRASAALLPAFAPVEIEGRMLGDAGISANLPLDCVLSEDGERPLLCLAIDLLPLHGPRPVRIAGSVLRMQDLVFAAQSRRAIAAWQAIFDVRARLGEGRAVTLIHLAYSDQAREVSGKAFDFSAPSAAHRWRSGHADMTHALETLDSGRIEVRTQAGLSVHARPTPDAPIAPVRRALSPAGA